MTQKEIESVTQDDIIAVYESYKCGAIARNDWVLYLVDLLDNYFKREIRRLHRTEGAEYADLMQNCYLMVVDLADVYDPHLSMPTSFFTTYITQYTKEILDNGGMSVYYVGIAAQLEKAAKEAGYPMGMTDPACDAQTLHILTGISLETIQNTLQQKQLQVASLDQVSENFSTPSSYANPEAALLEEEQNKFAHELYERLDPLEQYLVYWIDLAAPSEKKTYRSILLEIRGSDEMQQEFSKDLGRSYDQRTLEGLHNRAIQKMQNSIKTVKYLGIDNRTVVLEEQATEDDISNAVAAGILFGD